ncbi:MAG TPA: Asp-tRNA(Asn)/Glu-tRNA(Gln) amidotransferase subunit GatC [Nitrospiria bacterium]|nr:Asp-tRNA(Asn)/Glu-tRNA(Gln) amidotransferase subunit GatC [Nitrospiria bacterium]
MKISDEEVAHVARLAKLALSDEEKSAYTRQMEQILTHIDQLNEVETKGVEPTSHAIRIENIFREDQVTTSLPLDQALGNAPDQDQAFFRVPKIIE